jgi:NAD+ synthase|tara:strand:- start:6572 stop:7318 length:747 start_codon:yes stop_codon:yes gene_type:complete
MNNQDKIDFIVGWITDYVSKMPNPAKSLVVGVSGGVDSALTSTLASMTGLRTFALSMPISTGSNHSRLNSAHGQWLEEKFSNTTYMTIDLTSTYMEFNSLLTNSNQVSDLGFANTKSRLRMVTLYQVAAAQSGIVVGTGNKVEDFGVGFYTKYGDGGVDISPIADLMKSEVVSLASSLGIDRRILQAPPTDGLWDDDRTDEAQLGLSYSDLEDAMENKSSINRPKYSQIRQLNLHKMEPIPVCKMPKS